MVEIIIVFATTLIFNLLNNLIFIFGYLANPAGSFYLGTVHWPGDYFYYLSQFAQGKENWFLSQDLYTNDFMGKTLVGWVNVFIGRVFYFFSINHYWTYQISLFVFGLLFFYLSYLLIKEIFSSKKSKRSKSVVVNKRITAFVFFAFSTGFPIIKNEAGKWTVSYYDYWSNIGLVFINRLGGVPHQLIARCFLVLSILLSIWWWRRANKRWVLTLFLLISSFVLASINPVHYAFLVGVLFLTAFVKAAMDAWCKKALRLSLFLPSIIFFLGGFPVAFYLKTLFAAPPFLQLRNWEAIQSVKVSIPSFFLGNGIVAILAVFGILFFLKSKNILKILAYVFTLFSLILFFSPIPFMTSIVNVRFVPEVITVFFACFAAEIVFFFASVFGKKRRIVEVFLVFLVLLFTIPSLALQLVQKTKPMKNNAYYYIPDKVYDSFLEARSLTSKDSTFLVIWPFNASFPAISGRRTYTGHHLLTIDSGKKDGVSGSFFWGKVSTEEKEDILVKEKITHVLSYSSLDAEFQHFSNLLKIYDNGYMAIWKVY